MAVKRGDIQAIHIVSYYCFLFLIGFLFCFHILLNKLLPKVQYHLKSKNPLSRYETISRLCQLIRKSQNFSNNTICCQHIWIIAWFWPSGIYPNLNFCQSFLFVKHSPGLSLKLSVFLWDLPHIMCQMNPEMLSLYILQILLLMHWLTNGISWHWYIYMYMEPNC